MEDHTAIQPTNSPNFEVVGVEHLPPDAAGSAEIFSRLGYTLTEAIADIVDNSVDAKAKNVLIRFVRSTDKISQVLIIDDGLGMSNEKMSEAMRVGASVGKTSSSLGKYGVGLKSASLNQANALTILSLTDNKGVGRKWTTENIKKGWVCEVIEPKQAKQFLTQPFGPLRLKNSGTLVLWEDLQHLKTNAINIEATILKSIKALRVEIGLKFHRFIGDGRVRIFVDVQEKGRQLSDVYQEIEALDPFSYAISGHEGYPKTFPLKLGQTYELRLQAHIWPAKSSSAGYKLGGGKVSSRQGIYMYRNDRLIQAGGWNGCREDDTEPHFSLARVKIDLPANLDSAFQLDVTKSHVEPPPEFSQKLLASICKDGTTFKKYLGDAEKVYRKQKSKETASFKFVPRKGMPREAQEATNRLLWEKGCPKLVPIDFSWQKLDIDRIFEIDSSSQTILLNKTYRKQILGHNPASANDVPFVKQLIFFIVHDHLDRKATSEKYEEWLRKVNQSLISALSAGS